jgi:hypothetical protein
MIQARALDFPVWMARRWGRLTSRSEGLTLRGIQRRWLLASPCGPADRIWHWLFRSRSRYSGVLAASGFAGLILLSELAN